MQINILEAKNRLSELIREAQHGVEVLIANRGHPVVRLVPVAAQNKDMAVGSVQSVLEWLDLPRPDWMQRQGEQIDADVDQARTAWD